MYKKVQNFTKIFDYNFIKYDLILIFKKNNPCFRSLFERLEENKRLKQEMYDQQHDIKNVVRGIDDDEAAFLDKVDEIKSEAEIQRIKEERKELQEYKEMKEKLLEEEEHRRLSDLTAKKTKIDPDIVKKKQSKLLIGAVVKKRNITEEKLDKTDAGPSLKVQKTSNSLKLIAAGYSDSESE